MTAALKGSTLALLSWDPLRDTRRFRRKRHLESGCFLIGTAASFALLAFFHLSTLGYDSFGSERLSSVGVDCTFWLCAMVYGKRFKILI
jgi:hypothetical protein